MGSICTRANWVTALGSRLLKIFPESAARTGEKGAGAAERVAAICSEMR